MNLLWWIWNRNNQLFSSERSHVDRCICRNNIIFLRSFWIDTVHRICFPLLYPLILSGVVFFSVYLFSRYLLRCIVTVLINALPGNRPVNTNTDNNKKINCFLCGPRRAKVRSYRKSVASCKHASITMGDGVVHGVSTKTNSATSSFLSSRWKIATEGSS
jgi:hypothetical protein